MRQVLAMGKLWGGRFQKDTDTAAEGFQSSILFDQRLAVEDITGSIAHARMLGKQNIITENESETIISGLKGILEDVLSGKITFDVKNEDIHMNVESILTERIGETGKKLHTGRSRNDQVALDFRMFVRKETLKDIDLIKDLITALLNIAEQNMATYMPAYTHLQRAQPTSLAHYMMAYTEMFYRDITRFKDSVKRTDYMPLGSGALCATTYPLDRMMVAHELGFENITLNSIDGVSDRDFAVEYLACCSVLMMHLSRFCEEIILWATNEFGFVEIDDAYSTGSSIMPQKKNPDIAELIRGKTGRTYGDLITLLTVMKALPLAYNKDMQEDKEAVFDACDTVESCLTNFTGMISTVRFRKDTLYRKAMDGFTNATDAADYLVKKGLSFRDAHSVIGHLVLYCEKNGKSISDLDIGQLKEFSDLFEDDIYQMISLETCVDTRNIPGGPASEQVRKHIGIMKERLGQ